MCFSTSALNANITRARRCGLVAAQPGNAALAAATAASTVLAAANATSACTAPVLGLNTWPLRAASDMGLALMKWEMARMGNLQPNAWFYAGKNPLRPC